MAVPSASGKNQHPSCVDAQPLHDHLRHGQLQSYQPSETEGLGGSDWACSTLIEEECTISYQDTPCSHVQDPLASFPGDTTREANCSLPYVGTCWMAEHSSDGNNLPMPIDSDPNSHNGFSQYALSLEHVKHVPSSSPGLRPPAQMGHFTPFVHQGEPEMIFAGMELSNNEFHGLHYNQHQQGVDHQHLEHGHQPLYFPSGTDGNSDESGIDQFIQQQQLEDTNHAGLGPQQPDTDFHDNTRGEGTWSEDFHSTSASLVGTNTRKHSLQIENTPNAANESLLQDAPHIRRGRLSAGHKPSAAPARDATMHSIVGATTAARSSSFYAEVRLVTVLNDCYWKNGRKNLQCFPVCPEHNDFYSMKMNNRKHSSVGVCRGPVYCHVFAKAAQPGVAPSPPPPPSSPSRSALKVLPQPGSEACGSSLPSMPSGQQMKYEHGVGASGNGGSSQELFVLGRFERVPQRDNTDLIEELGAPPEFTSSAAFEEFRYGCFQAVEMQERRTTFASCNRENLPQDNIIATRSPLSSSPAAAAAAAATTGSSLALSCATHASEEQTPTTVRSTWFFLPDVWKVQPMLKKKRKATRSAPAQTFPFCFRVFVYTRDPNVPSTSSKHSPTGHHYTCISSTVSSFFELYSTRTVDRVKRKYWSSAPLSSSSSSSSSRAAHGAKKTASSAFPTASKRQTR